jgi:DNA-binding FadR family transcriptional regulator
LVIPLSSYKFLDFLTACATIISGYQITMIGAFQLKGSKSRFRVIGHKDGLVDRVVHAIQDEVFSGRLTVGTRLPPEREFAESLGVSRPVVREAVRILITKGLLETRHGIGTTVRAVSRDEVIQPLTLFLRTRGEEIGIRHLHQARSVIEVENVALAAEEGTEEDMRDLARICEEMEAVAAQPRLFADKDSEFHRRLGETTHNPLLILLLDSIRDMMVEVRDLVADEEGLFEGVMPTHRRILECVAARDVIGAREAMREHLETALSIQTQAIEKHKKELKTTRK